jgi:hypothetical protein
MHVKDDLCRFCKNKVGNRRRTRFLEDLWTGDKPLMVAFPRIYI